MKAPLLALWLGVVGTSFATEWRVPAVDAAAPDRAPLEADGAIRSGEWQGAASLELPGGGRLLALRSGARVWLAIVPAAAHATYVDLFLQDGAGVTHNLHASLQWGERIVSGEAWTDQEPATAWGRPQRWGANRIAWAPGGREAKEVTRASFTPYEAHEFWIERAAFAGATWRLRVEVRDFAGKVPDTVAPEESSRYRPDGWLVLRVE